MNRRETIVLSGFWQKSGLGPLALNPYILGQA